MMEESPFILHLCPASSLGLTQGQVGNSNSKGAGSSEAEEAFLTALFLHSCLTDLLSGF